mmetsp:Transcript_40805/g.128658  ORF Transcript_40805/g.128658 Transcript_40805/m.128658 type:complete len:288 (-) Transcript_40805:43-906(-)
MKTCSPAAAPAPAVSTAAASLPSTCHASLTAPPSPLTPIEHVWGEPAAWLARSRRGMRCSSSPNGSARDSTIACAHKYPAALKTERGKTSGCAGSTASTAAHCSRRCCRACATHPSRWLPDSSCARSSSAHSRGMPTISSPDGSSSMYGQLEQLASPRLSCSSRPRASSAEWSSLGTTLATAAPTGPAATELGVRCSAVGMESSVSPCATPSGPATRQTPQPGSFAGSTASLAMPLSDSQARKEASSGGAAAGAAEATVPRASRAEATATKWRGAARRYASAAERNR